MYFSNHTNITSYSISMMRMRKSLLLVCCFSFLLFFMSMFFCIFIYIYVAIHSSDSFQLVLNEYNTLLIHLWLNKMLISLLRLYFNIFCFTKYPFKPRFDICCFSLIYVVFSNTITYISIPTNKHTKKKKKKKKKKKPNHSKPRHIVNGIIFG